MGRLLDGWFSRWGDWYLGVWVAVWMSGWMVLCVDSWIYEWAPYFN